MSGGKAKRKIAAALERTPEGARGIIVILQRLGWRLRPEGEQDGHIVWTFIRGGNDDGPLEHEHCRSDRLTKVALLHMCLRREPDFVEEAGELLDDWLADVLSEDEAAA